MFLKKFIYLYFFLGISHMYLHMYNSDMYCEYGLAYGITWYINKLLLRFQIILVASHYDF